MSKELDVDNLYNLVMFGASTKNGANTSKMFSVRIQPEVEDQMEAIREVAPVKWFEDGATLKRACVMVGLRVILGVLEEKVKLAPHQKAKLEAVKIGMQQIGIIAQKSRADALQRQADKIHQSIARGDHPERGALGAEIATMSALLDKVLRS